MYENVHRIGQLRNPGRRDQSGENESIGQPRFRDLLFELADRSSPSPTHSHLQLRISCGKIRGQRQQILVALEMEQPGDGADGDVRFLAIPNCRRMDSPETPADAKKAAVFIPL